MPETDDEQPVLDLSPYVTAERLLASADRLPFPEVQEALKASLRTPATRADLIGIVMAQAKIWSTLSFAMARLGSGSQSEITEVLNDLAKAAREQDAQLSVYLSSMFTGKNFKVDPVE